MSDELEQYSNRSQTFFKHLFLRQYLEIAAFKVLQGPAQSINYVDGFAGPYKSSDLEVGTDISPVQAKNVLEGVRESLTKRDGSQLKIRYFLCERDAAAFENLKNITGKWSNIEPKLYRGKFEDNIKEIYGEISRYPQSFTITFIDPAGWTVESEKIFSTLNLIQGEIFFNFMSENINRFGGLPKSESRIGQFLANPEWRIDYDRLNLPSRGEKILHILKERMKKSGVAKFVPDAPIYDLGGKRQKMRLVLATRHQKGLAVFRDVQSKVENEAVRLKNNSDNLPWLLSDEQLIKIEKGRDGVGGAFAKDQTSKVLINILKERTAILLGEAADITMEMLPMREPDIKDVAMELKISKRIEYTLAERKRKPTRDTVLQQGTEFDAAQLFD